MLTKVLLVVVSFFVLNAYGEYHRSQGYTEGFKFALRTIEEFKELNNEKSKEN